MDIPRSPGRSEECDKARGIGRFYPQGPKSTEESPHILPSSIRRPPATAHHMMPSKTCQYQNTASDLPSVTPKRGIRWLKGEQLAQQRVGRDAIFLRWAGRVVYNLAPLGDHEIEQLGRLWSIDP